MGLACILIVIRRLQGLQKCALLLILFFLCILHSWHNALISLYPAAGSSQLLILHANQYIVGATAAHHHLLYSANPQGSTSSPPPMFSSHGRLSSPASMEALQELEKRVLIHGDGQLENHGGGDYTAGEMKKVQALRKRIGSRPPICRDKCEACFPCEAVKMVPDPSTSSSSSAMQNVAHLDYSNYDPEGWKCKCGARIFNP